MKLKQAHRKRKITDTDYNDFVGLLGLFKTFSAYKKRLRIYSPDIVRLESYLRNNYSSQYSRSEQKRESGDNPYLLLYFGSKTARNNFLSKLGDMKTNGPIVSYNSANNGVTANGKTVILSGTPGKQAGSGSGSGNGSGNGSGSGSGSGSGNGSGNGSGSDTTTILIVAGLAFLAFLIFKKRKAVPAVV